MSPSVVVVASLKPERTRLVEFNILEESFLWLKESSCNKSVALPGSTSTLCTSKPLIKKGEYKRIIMGHNDLVWVY